MNLSFLNIGFGRKAFAKAFLPLLFLACWQPAGAQIVMSLPLELEWKGVEEHRRGDNSFPYIALESAQYKGPMPVYVGSTPIFDGHVRVDFALEKVVSSPLSDEEMSVAIGHDYEADFVVDVVPLCARDEAFLTYKIVPFRQVGGGLEKLLSAVLSVTLTPDFGKALAQPAYAHRSAMASGEWYKIGLSETGVHKLTYDDLASLGLNLAGLDPRQLRVYHNGGGLLPEMNAQERHDDLVEIPIYVYGEADGKFDRGDYVLFYGRGPVCWKYNAQQSLYKHEPNPYENYSYAFVVTGLGAGKRIGEYVEPSGNADVVVSEFVDYRLHDADDSNLNRTGRTRYGDKMDGFASMRYSFVFPNIVKSRPCRVVSQLAGRNYKPASFEVYVNDVLSATYSIPSVSASGDSYDYATETGGRIEATPVGDTVSVRLQHRGVANSVSEGYVDCLVLNAWRKLTMTGGQMMFRNPEAADINKVYEYRLSGASQQTQVWNVSDPVAPSIAKAHPSGSVLSFKVAGSDGNEFVAFDGSRYLVATPFGKVENQNLHEVRDVDYLIVSYADFVSEAERLKAIHAEIDPDMTVFVTTPEKIYNEFSCGAKDISAIRDFCRMLYLDSSPGRKIKYLLLVGDCSFDQKNRLEVVDFVPSFESVSSLSMLKTFVTDDFFGFMDENEGDINRSIADIGVGRFPVTTLEQASQMVDKVERYVAKTASTMNPWRNVITFTTDDEDTFMADAEALANVIKAAGGDAVVTDKIYLDAYVQESSPGGEVCPEMNSAINSRVEKGTLVLNYIGHGGETQLAVERILQKKDVDSWRNAPMYPLMITGTCEFSRYDDHKRTSLGEYAFLNSYGGMVAMFTTSRVTSGPDNKRFMGNVYNKMFQLAGGEYYALGDLYRMAKTSGNDEEKRYVLFGDPALRLAYPKWKVETLSINGQAPETWLDSVQINDTTWETHVVYNDTIKALQSVEIAGVVKNLDGQVADGFNGVVHVTVYDKAARLSTLGSDPHSSEKPFLQWNSIIFNGKTEAENGRFVMRFIVPRDIAYRYGQGMISYYATDYDIDANGICEDFIIGGFDEQAVIDDNPPEVRLFINDTLFVSGGVTGESPVLLAFMSDESGINTTGAGIGHDITATLSGPSKAAYRLNDYFEADINDAGKGQIAYKLQNLADGDYTLTLKVWDIYNNSGSASINFTVVNSNGMYIDNPVNYPNPVDDETFFVFEHNQTGNNMEVRIDIFDVMGRWVNTLAQTVSGSDTRTAPIRWDGRGSHGESLKNGIYAYRIITVNDEGEMASVVSKLVISK